MGRALAAWRADLARDHVAQLAAMHARRRPPPMRCA